MNWKGMVMRAASQTLNRLGYELHRKPVAPTPTPLVPTRVGAHTVLLFENARVYPGRVWDEKHNGELSRVVSLALTKYPDLAAIDVGANFGDTAAVVKTAGDVPIFCIEGDPRVFEILEQNIRQFPDVTARNVLLGERVEELPVVFQKEGWNLTVVPSSGPSSTTVSLTTLDECALGLEDLDRYRVLKVDVEGFDCRVIRGGMSYIERVRPVILMEYNRENMDAIGENGLDTLMRLRDAGYSAIVYFDQSGRMLLSTTLDEIDLIRDLHDYANGRDGSIYYVDLCLFHTDDADLAAEFTRTERARRRGEPHHTSAVEVATVNA
ncbi:MAG TPA: FkbM family methyltransferase [Gemmatirosa sp.]